MSFLSTAKPQIFMAPRYTNKGLLMRVHASDENYKQIHTKKCANCFLDFNMSSCRVKVLRRYMPFMIFFDINGG